MRVAAPPVPEVCPIEPLLVDLRGAARIMAVSTWTIRDWVSAGLLRRVVLPGGAGSQDGALHRLRFAVADLRRLVEQGKAEGA